MSGDLLNNQRLLWDVLWQTSACLAGGAALSLWWSRRPARAHRVLLLALVASVVTPALSLVVRQLDWGWLTPPPLNDRMIEFASPSPAAPESASLDQPQPLLPSHRDTQQTGPQVARQASAVGAPAMTASELSAVPSADGADGAKYLGLPRMPLLLGLWLVGSTVLLAGVFRSYLRAVRLANEATPITDGPIMRAADVALRRLGLRGQVDIRSSSGVRCPAIWCWRRRPVLLVPTTCDATTLSAGWRDVLCHELAHWRRRDHVAGLFAEVTAALLWWQLLVWWCKRRLGLLSERACDDWVLALGGSAPDYADTLVNVAVQQPATVALAAVSSRKNLVARVRHILRNEIHSPKVGVCWAGVTTLLVAGAVAVAAFAQTRAPQPAVQVDARRNNTAVAESDVEPSGTGPQSAAAVHRLGLRVIDRETRRPLPGVEVKVHLLYKTRDEETKEPDASREQRSRFRHERPTLVTTEDGLAVLDVPRENLKGVSIKFNKSRYTPMNLSWWGPRAPGSVIDLPGQCTVPMERAASIGGIVQDEDGRPVGGATVSLMYDDYDSIPPTGVPYMLVRAEQHTDAEGRWECSLVPANLGSDELFVNLQHPDYPREAEDVFEHLDAPLSALRNKSAVLVLKKDRRVTATVEGRVVDLEGRPIAGATIQPGWEHDGHFSFREIEHGEALESDADGRFRIENARPTRLRVSRPGDVPTDLLLTVQAPGYAPEARSVTLAPDMGPVEFRLGPGHTIRGCVIDPAGNGVEGVEIDADQWRDHRALRWRAKTNVDGRFVWNSAPADEVLVSLRKEGYMRMHEHPISASSEEQVLTMHPELRIRGTVRDADTGDLIEHFKVTHGYETAWQRTIRWQRERAAAFRDGEYEVSFDFPYPGYVLQIEADGYQPVVSRMFYPDEGTQSCDFRLERGHGPAGVVKTPDGEPAANAEIVFWSAARRDVQITYRDGRAPLDSEGLLRSSGIRSQRSYSDTDGHFKFDATMHPDVLTFIHDQGYGEVTAKELASSPEVTLRPWGRVEGALRVGAQAAGSRLVMVSVSSYEPNRLSIAQTYGVMTDGAGHFAVERAAPGGGSIGPYHKDARSQGYLYTQGATVQPGQTTHLTLGGVGRPVVGRLVAPVGFVPEIDWDFGWADMYLKAPTPPDVKASGNEAVQAWWEAWRQSEEGQAHGRSANRFSAELNSDHSFRIEDVPAGRYVLRHGLPERPPRGTCGSGRPIVSIKHEFEVPPMAGGRSDEPLDLGTLELKPVAERKRLKVGELGPPIVVQTLDGKTLKLEDLRGKYVLLEFWATWCGPCRVETPKLKAVYEKFGGDKRFAMASLSLDHNVRALRDYIEENEIKWTQAYLGQWSQTKLPDAYGVYGIPSIFLIGPDGKILATDLRGDAIEQTVERALRKR